MFSRVDDVLQKSKLRDFLVYLSLTEMIKDSQSEEQLTEIFEKYVK